MQKKWTNRVHCLQFEQNKTVWKSILLYYIALLLGNFIQWSEKLHAANYILNNISIVKKISIPRSEQHSDNIQFTSDSSNIYFDAQASDVQSDIKLHQRIYCVKFALSIPCNDIKKQLTDMQHQRVTRNFKKRTCNVQRIHETTRTSRRRSKMPLNHTNVYVMTS